MEVGEEIGDGGADGLGNDFDVRLCRRFGNRPIENVVEFVDRAVPRFPRILRRARGVGRQRNAGTQARRNNGGKRNPREAFLPHGETLPNRLWMLNECRMPNEIPYDTAVLSTASSMTTISVVVRYRVLWALGDGGLDFTEPNAVS